MRARPALATSLEVRHRSAHLVRPAGNEPPPSMERFRQFVIHLLLLRKRDSSLHSCELRFRDPNQTAFSVNWHWLDADKLGLNLWIRHIVDCEVRILRLEIQKFYFRFATPLVSQHLTTLALVGVMLRHSLCNLSNCPNLEHLEFATCEFYGVKEISSKSLKHLSFSHYCDFDMELERHTLICTPSLVSLRLDMHFSTLPVLDSMPSLKVAFLRDPISDCEDECFTCNKDEEYMEDRYNESFLLQQLSEVENLTLISDYNGVYFCKDLEWSPTFNNLRTLMLNEWCCVDPDFNGLNYILKHSPVLEKLTLHLLTKGPQHKVEMIGRYNQMERSASISKHLKEIEVKFDVLNEQIHKVLKFLGTFGIYFLFK